jgi:hypothetical protein
MASPYSGLSASGVLVGYSESIIQDTISYELTIIEPYVRLRTATSDFSFTVLHLSHV